LGLPAPRIQFGAGILTTIFKPELSVIYPVIKRRFLMRRIISVVLALFLTLTVAIGTAAPVLSDIAPSGANNNNLQISIARNPSPTPPGGGPYHVGDTINYIVVVNIPFFGNSGLISAWQSNINVSFDPIIDNPANPGDNADANYVDDTILITGLDLLPGEQVIFTANNAHYTRYFEVPGTPTRAELTLPGSNVAMPGDACFYDLDVPGSYPVLDHVIGSGNPPNEFALSEMFLQNGEWQEQAVARVWNIQGSHSSLSYNDSNDKVSTISTSVSVPDTTVQISSSSSEVNASQSVTLTITERNTGSVDITSPHVELLKNGEVFADLAASPNGGGDIYSPTGVLNGSFNNQSETWTWTVDSGPLNCDTTFEAIGHGFDDSVPPTDITYPTYLSEMARTCIEVITPPPGITTDALLPAGEVGSYYSQSLTAADGAPPYNWSIISGDLPGGLILIPDTGVIFGTPSAAVDAVNFTVMVTDNENKSDTRDFSLTILPQFPVLFSIDPGSIQASSGSFTITATGENFNAGSTLKWRDFDDITILATTVISSTELEAIVPSELVDAPQTADIWVCNPTDNNSNLLPFFVTATAAGVTSCDTETSAEGTATASTGGTGPSTPDSLTATAIGEGTISVAQYDANPGGTPSFAAADSFFDVYVSQDSIFAEVIITANNLNGGTTVYWWNGTDWILASDQVYNSDAESVTIMVNAVTVPNLEDLRGAIFGVELPFNTLKDIVKQSVLNSGFCTSLLSKLEAARVARLNGNIKASNNQIGAFINEIKAQSGKKISAEIAANLITLARSLQH
jgi:hypothetical protein